MNTQTEIEKQFNSFLRAQELHYGLSPITINSYRRYLAHFLSFVKVNNVKSISLKHLKSFKENLLKDNTDYKTKNIYITAVRSFLRYCNDEGYTKLNKGSIEPLRYRQTKKHLDLPNIEDFKKLLTVTDISNPTETETFINLAYYTGLRLSELRALIIGEVAETFSVVGKGAKERLVICPSHVVALVRAYENRRLQSPYKQPLLFPYSPSSYQQKLSDLGMEHNIDLHPHMLRHMFASTLVSNGADIFAVSSLLGHSSVSTTQIYAKISNKKLEDIHKSVFA